MTKRELQEELDRLGVRREAYCLDGGTPHNRFVLDHDYAGWWVYYSERGLRIQPQNFGTEDAACRYFLERITASPDAWPGYQTREDFERKVETGEGFEDDPETLRRLREIYSRRKK